MILLCRDKYGLADEAIKEMPSNNLFARVVTNGEVDGRIYVDHPEHPRTFYIVHPYGMSLLTGEENNPDFNRMFCGYVFNKPGERKTHDWMQVYPDRWNDKLKELFGDRIIPSSVHTKPDTDVVELNTRINFRFNPEKYKQVRPSADFSKVTIVRTDEPIFHKMTGTVVPLHFWKDARNFVEKGVGFSLFYDGELASTAFSAYIFEDMLEMGIETYAGFQGKGLALVVCCALIDYCIENRKQPVWSCRLENMASYRTALKLGFEPTFELPYYRLPV